MGVLGAAGYKLLSYYLQFVIELFALTDNGELVT